MDIASKYHRWPELDKACVTTATLPSLKKIVLPEAKPFQLVLQLKEL
jgi:hypothetical protein